MTRAHPLRVRLPARDQIPTVDALGRPFRGRAALARRLYTDERCSLVEIAAYLSVHRHAVSRMLRMRSVRPRPTTPIGRAFVQWVGS